MNTPHPQPFGYLLRTHRRAAGLTQEQLAGYAGLSSRAVGDLERGATLPPHHDTIQLLTAALNLSGKQHSEFEAAARRAATSRLSPVLAASASSLTPVVVARDAGPGFNLPAATNSFVGP